MIKIEIKLDETMTQTNLATNRMFEEFERNNTAFKHRKFKSD